MRRKDRTGERFGRLTVISPADGTRTPWVCRCDCGNLHTVRSSNLVAGYVRSCGCLNREAVAERNRSHGMSDLPEFAAWQAMKQRCTDPTLERYPEYGGRGISVCDEWASDFPAFLTHMGLRPSPLHSLDRLDVNGNYEPGNVRWATRKQQARNKRNNRLIEIDGRKIPLAQAAEEFGIPDYVIRRRLDIGWPVERALRTQARCFRCA